MGSHHYARNNKSRRNASHSAWGDTGPYERSNTRYSGEQFYGSNKHGMGGEHGGMRWGHGLSLSPLFVGVLLLLGVVLGALLLWGFIAFMGSNSDSANMLSTLMGKLLALK